ncbi:MAG: hypothetical protein E5X94_00635 [Mesorhizobium sp.]|uniref:hypothetical protein n=1 Tax=Mesorhizobium sp. TaxID=1871066 RepID=UPI0011F5ADE8|nr:hypothetical protein [Mesorhizobium sp.]TIN82757.1 MAG: hypothetical protein E5X97_29060 [Mesorhizobium sp.]TIN88345.1 MAG: hypothetical protein E5X94_00635 [Mesorhizobium sp.]
MADENNLEARKVLLGQAKALGMEVDGRWSVDTLAEKVQEAQESKRDADIAAIKAASDTWVYLLRDAFPVEDEKHLAGETIKVPADMADRWYEASVARPGKEPAE